jgi:hypothetical protein
LEVGTYMNFYPYSFLRLASPPSLRVYTNFRAYDKGGAWLTGVGENHQIARTSTRYHSKTSRSPLLPGTRPTQEGIRNYRFYRERLFERKEGWGFGILWSGPDAKGFRGGSAFPFSYDSGTGIGPRIALITRTERTRLKWGRCRN